MRRLNILLWMGILIAAVSSAAVPTPDTLVVALSGDESTTTEAKVEEVTTEEPHLPIKLTEMQVHTEIALRYAHTTVVTTVRNPAKRAQEAAFRVLLPETAFISGFVMTLDGKSYKAYVKEKEEAKQIYNQAVSQGVAAAHISAKARDSNHFMVSVNVEPNTTAVFNLTYEELLVLKHGVYNHAVNLHPGALVPKMKLTVHIREAEKITKLKVPEVRTGNEIEATEEYTQNPIAQIDRGHDDREATITFKPNLEEQKRLAEVYSVKSKESAANRDNSLDKQEGTLGQFVVQYDVDRSKNGEVLVNDGYFVHFLAPTSLPPLKKHAVFVLDTSGSMSGRKVDQLRQAMQTILEKLNPGDYFSIIEFNSDVVVHDLQEADKPPSKRPSYHYYDEHDEPPTLVPPSLATTENIAKAKVIVSRLEAYGGTNINKALSVAIDVIREASPTPNNALEGGRAADTPADSSKDGLEPIIIFLTDGDPTTGVTDTARILTHLSEKNYGERKASIFSLAFGEDADRGFLRKLSLKNEGFLRHIYEAADAALQLRDFYQQVSSPLLSNVKFTYPKEQIKEGSVTRSNFRAVYDGSEVVVAGRVADDVNEIAPHVTGWCAVDDGARRKKYDITHKIPVTRAKKEYMPLERLWAYLTIKQLLDEKDVSDADNKAENSPEKQALNIALKYSFVTPLTSLVVVKPNATHTAVDAESADKPSFDYADSSPHIIPLSGHYMSSSYAFAASPNKYFSAPQDSFIAAEDLAIDEDYDYGGTPHRKEDNRNYLISPRHRHHSYGHGLLGAWGTSDLWSSSIGRGYGFSRRDPTLSSSIFSDVSTTARAPPATARAPPATSRLIQYHLDEFPWADDLINDSSDTMDLTVNGTQVNLKLTKDSKAPIESGGDAQCAKATNATSGVCVYVTRCRSAKQISSVQYAELYCTIADGYAGICCPSEEVDKIEHN